MKLANPQDYSCPVCRRVDRVQRVRALVEEGTVAGVYNNPLSGTPISGITLSAKVSQLALPAGPIFRKQRWGCGSLILVVLGMGFGLIFSFMFAASLVIPLIPANSNATSQGGTSSNPLAQLGALVFFFILVAICFGIVRLVLHRRDKINSALLAQHQLDVSQWQRKKDNWNRLYYCARDDAVYFPGNPGACVEASQMSWLL